MKYTLSILAITIGIALQSFTSPGGVLITFQGLRFGEIPVSEAKKGSELKAKHQPERFIVQSFDLKVSSGELTKSFSSSNNKLTPEMKKYIQILKGGDEIVFSNIKVSYGEERTIPAPNIKLNLK